MPAVTKSVACCNWFICFFVFACISRVFLYFGGEAKCQSSFMTSQMFAIVSVTDRSLMRAQWNVRPFLLYHMPSIFLPWTLFLPSLNHSLLYMYLISWMCRWWLFCLGIVYHVLSFIKARKLLILCLNSDDTKLMSNTFHRVWNEISKYFIKPYISSHSNRPFSH